MIIILALGFIGSSSSESMFAGRVREYPLGGGQGRFFSVLRPSERTPAGRMGKVGSAQFSGRVREHPLGGGQGRFCSVLRPSERTPAGRWARSVLLSSQAE
ncbi:hypothetical protein RRG08_052128 [Elysia crispata]|uniref:Secreted protein n=1 Tax=Elysia crispata TaxID=231223 RepID=A0AAE1A5D1_9GAST|nr:hypothetical protein RRG08_052128 [Elysia crispata]